MRKSFGRSARRSPIPIVAALTACAFGSCGTKAYAEPEPAYALDTMSRSTARRGPVQCPKVDRVLYRGEVIAYAAPALVHPEFVPHLRQFETIARDVAIEVYGRAPKRIRHLGTFNCRRIGGYPELLSEHAFGNAIDIAGFEFAGLSRKERAESKLPRSLQNAFEVTVATGGKREPLHDVFLHRLIDRLLEKHDVFRVLLGPAYPGHHDHFHFDMAPYRMVDVWEDESK